MVSVVAAVLGAGVIGPAIAVIGIAWLVTYTLRRVGVSPPQPPRPHLSLQGLRELADYVVRLIVWAAPIVPFVAPAITFVAVTWPLPKESEGLLFQEQASQIMLVLLIGYVVEAGALRWRRQPVDWLLSLVTALILLVGEVYCLVALASNDPSHADIIAGAMAAGVVAILTAASRVFGTERPEGEAQAPPPKS